MKESSVSVITPVKDGQDWIPGLIQNLCAQTLLPSELIIVDDHSRNPIREDGFGLARYFDVKVLNNSGFGVSDARNTALRVINSKYIAFLDCDDRWDPYKLETQLREMRSSGLPASCAEFRQVNLNRVVLQERKASKRVITLEDVLSGTDVVYGSASGVVLESEFASNIGYFDSHLSYAEDLDYWLRCLSASPMSVPSGVLVTIYRHKNSSQDKYLEDSHHSNLELGSLRYVLQKYPAFSEPNFHRIFEECASRFLQRRLSFFKTLSILGSSLLKSNKPFKLLLYMAGVFFNKKNLRKSLRVLKKVIRRAR